MDAVVFVLGLLLLALAFWDMFETIVVPRPTPGWFRISRYLVRGCWRIVRTIRDGRPERSYDRLLGTFAPAMAIALLGAWLAALILGYGLLMFALRSELQPPPADLGGAIYFAASSVLTLGFGDIVAVGTEARVIILTGAVTGLGAVALVVTFLFSLFGSYQRREIQVVALQAAAGAPPSAVALLESYAQLDLVERLPTSLLNGNAGRRRCSTRTLPSRCSATFAVSKPLQLDVFQGLVASLADFWLDKAKLPPRGQIRA